MRVVWRVSGACGVSGVWWRVVSCRTVSRVVSRVWACGRVSVCASRECVRVSRRVVLCACVCVVLCACRVACVCARVVPITTTRDTRLGVSRVACCVLCVVSSVLLRFRSVLSSRRYTHHTLLAMSCCHTHLSHTLVAHTLGALRCFVLR